MFGIAEAIGGLLFRILMFRVLGFRVLGFRVLGFRVLGFRTLGCGHCHRGAAGGDLASLVLPIKMLLVGIVELGQCG